MATVERVRTSLAAREPRRIDEERARRAAVAMVLRDGAAGADVLFIERARHPDDPWSGHMAFPGGRVDPEDTDARAAAERETLEEVGVCLADAELLGQLDDKRGNPATRPELVISAYVYYLPVTPPRLVPNYEVEEAFWFPVGRLLDPVRHVEYRARRQYGELAFPGILVGRPERHVVWGLTYSFLESFFEALGEPLPDRWSEAMRHHARSR